MTYPVIASRRIPYDIDGTAVGYRTMQDTTDGLSVLFGQGIATNLTGADLTNFNKEDRSVTVGLATASRPKWGIWFLFPELRNITRVGFLFPVSDLTYIGRESLIQGSADTTNGVDGTWETATYTLPTTNLNDADNWRDNTVAVTFTVPVIAVRIGQASSNFDGYMNINAIHLYGSKATGQTVDDLIFTDVAGTELTSLKDWGDRPEGTLSESTFKVKNVSPDKACTSISIISSDPTITISWSETTGFTDTLTIASLGADSLSGTIYVKHTLAVPPLTLGPVAGRITVTGTWS